MNWLSTHVPAVSVVLISIVIGFLMVVLFRYTSDQKAIRIAKDQLKGHLLAVRLFQDQLPVVMLSYGRILVSTGRYLRLAIKPLLFVALPLTLMIVQLDRYLGLTGLHPGSAFLVIVRTRNVEALDTISLRLPSGIETTAPPVHIPANSEIVWRVVAKRGGIYDIDIQAIDQSFAKQIVVSSALMQISPVRWRGHFWERWLTSGEPQLPATSTVEAIAVNFPARTIRFAGMDWNWIWLFTILSLIAGFVFKSLLGIDI